MIRVPAAVLLACALALSSVPSATAAKSGTMSDYGAIVSRKTFKFKLVEVGEKPYCATNSGDGKSCFMSVSGEDRVSVISYKTSKEVRQIPVGDHPQRMRMGRIRQNLLRR